MPTAARHSFEVRRGELVMRIEAPSLAALFAEAGRALATLMRVTPLEPPVLASDEIVVTGDGREALLVEWVNAVVLRAEAAKALFTTFEVTHLSHRKLVALARGSHVQRLRNPVKAATLRGLTGSGRRGPFTARLVLDV